MVLRCIIETKFVPSVLVNYEKQSDGESSDERKSNVQQIFVYTKTGSYKSFRKTLYVFSIHTSSDGIKSAQMLAITDFHTVTHVMIASVNFTLYDNKFGLQGYYYSKHRLLAFLEAVLCLN